VSVDQRWRKSRRSASGEACVELSGALDAVRDSKNPSGPVLSVAGLTALVRDARSGKLDR
jgi:hypothetical protein